MPDCGVESTLNTINYPVPSPAPLLLKTSIQLHIEMSTEAPEIPQTQKAVVYDDPGKVSTKVVDLPVPEPGPGEVLINL